MTAAPTAALMRRIRRKACDSATVSVSINCGSSLGGGAAHGQRMRAGERGRS